MLPHDTVQDPGAVVRRARKARGLTQGQLGDLVGCAASTVSRWETGVIRLDLETRRRLADLLAIPLQHLGLDASSPTARSITARVGGIIPGSREDHQVLLRRHLLAAVPAGFLGASAGLPAHSLTDQITISLEQALLIPPGDLRPVPLPVLRRMLADAQSDFAAAAYQRLGERLPKLLALAQTTAATEPPPAGALYADAAALAAHLGIKTGVDHLAWVAADRAVTAARPSGDPVALAEATRMLVILARRAGRRDRALTLAVDAADALSPHLVADPRAGRLHARLLCTAGYTAAGAGDRDAAGVLLGEAAARAEAGTPEATQIALYQVSAALALGDAGHALTHARGVTPAAGLTPERAGRYWVDVALALAQLRQPANAWEALRRAEAAAPEEVRARPVVRDLASDLLAAPGARPAGLRAFATRVGITS
ncbi:helix-turn-helix transcriptional regulator [Frankia sp. CNm7]|uniref:Helix-turn-helix transcriptional regulator n=1 Tax=Frankia nepalensis TaxID=1836974 RepID=A0A937R5H1_9ACTN|nr:helix-turn-helix transcriptional regulator [Frankia nepalensis]MBL7496963.1 helix-turn-helix transcriptional regulator [Frankia nepalensis]MBL7511336.1 helix-turn-helix transcriptional regulator [Frankia nepalensis]MBL7523893.1 helix-turn-helix transcriptional regulator [Frankia nepalensis]MBL7626103.1 helix-turn-helix transcriptional regulator [Frankia nepalensis]